MFNYKKSGSTTSVAQSAWKSTVGGSKTKRKSTSQSVTLEKARQILREYYAKTGSLAGLREKMQVGAGSKRRKSVSATQVGGRKRKSPTKRKLPKKSPKKSPKKKGGKRKSPRKSPRKK